MKSKKSGQELLDGFKVYSPCYGSLVSSASLMEWQTFPEDPRIYVDWLGIPLLWLLLESDYELQNSFVKSLRKLCDMKHSPRHTDSILLPPSNGPNINISTSKSSPLSLNCLSYNLSLFSENVLPLLAVIEMQLSPENVLFSIAFLGDGFLFLITLHVTGSGGAQVCPSCFLLPFPDNSPSLQQNTFILNLMSSDQTTYLVQPSIGPWFLEYFSSWHTVTLSNAASALIPGDFNNAHR